MVRQGELKFLNEGSSQEQEHIQVKTRTRLSIRTQVGKLEIKSSSTRKKNKTRLMNKNPKIHKRKKDSQTHNQSKTSAPLSTTWEGLQKQVTLTWVQVFCMFCEDRTQSSPANLTGLSKSLEQLVR